MRRREPLYRVTRGDPFGRAGYPDTPAARQYLHRVNEGVREEQRLYNFMRGRGAVPARLRAANRVVNALKPLARLRYAGPAAIAAGATYGAWRAGRAVKRVIETRRNNKRQRLDNNAQKRPREPEPDRDIDDEPGDDEFRPRPPPGPFTPFNPGAGDADFSDAETEIHEPGEDPVQPAGTCHNRARRYGARSRSARRSAILGSSNLRVTSATRKSNIRLYNTRRCSATGDHWPNYRLSAWGAPA